MVVKLDEYKIFGKVKWDLLFQILEKFGFIRKVITLIRECMTIIHYLILVNGVFRGFLGTPRGIR